MREESIWGYVYFGTVLRFLQDAEPAQPIRGEGQILYNLERFFEKLDDLGLIVTANVVRIEKLHHLLKELEKAADGDGLTEDQATHLSDGIETVRKTLVAELIEKKAFVTSPKRWDVDRLLNDPGKLFGDEVFARLDTQAAVDLSEACKCIAYERPTAAVFHMMRGTEAVLRSFYCHVVRQKRLPAEKRMWGAMVKALKERSQPPPKPLLDNLDAIRHNYRNPTQHPDANYSIEQAQDLLGLIIPAINEMVNLESS